MTHLQTTDCSPFVKNTEKADAGIKPAEEQSLKTLSKYFLESNPDFNDWDDQIVSLRTTRCLENSSEWQTLWWAGRYIGHTIINKTEISILPRFGGDFLLSIIEEVYNIRIFNNDAKTEHGYSEEWFSNLLNVLRYKMWVSKCARANRYGLPRTNVKHEHQGVTVKGRIDIHSTLLPWMLKKEVVSNTTEKVLDDSICKIVYEAYRILAKNVKQNKPLKRKKDNKLTYFSTNDTPIAAQDAINALNNSYKGTMVNMSESDYKRIRYKSIYVTWKPLVDFSWSIIKGKKIGMKESDTQSECVFVDMAEIWEAFLRKKLSEGMTDEGWRVWTVDECKREVYKDSFFKRHIIPDIVLHRISRQDGKDEFLVFDAKYKRMSVKKGAENGEGNKYDVDRSDFFQIHTYIHYFQHVYSDSRVLLGGLLYPLDEKFEDFKVNNLFGENGSFNTKFIVDGIICTNLKTDDNQNVKKTMQTRVDEMINRIKSQIN
jgi:5-methylcytosine-specific restriction endonuclease McrBC regulatory subunit McrC